MSPVSKPRLRLAACRSGFGEQRLEGAKIAGAAHHNQVVAALHSGFGGRVEYHYATFLANGHDDDAHLLAQLHFLDGLGHHLASSGDAHLFDGDILADVLGGEVQELHDVGAPTTWRRNSASSVRIYGPSDRSGSATCCSTC